MHMILFSFVILAAIVATAFLFIFWLVVLLFRGITRLFLGPGLKQPRPLPLRDPQYTRRCERESCQSINPIEARFCRRCGQRMDDPHRVAVRRAAML